MQWLVAAAVSFLLPGWTSIATGPDGGSLWQGRITSSSRISVVYVPPAFEPSTPYALLVVLHGFPGDAWSVGLGLGFARIADDAIASGRVAPFVMVAPSAAPRAGEWAGRSETWLVRTVLPWARARLPVLPRPVLAGYSAGGYGAVDIGLRHPRLFGALESWSGYFHPYRDGPLRGASRAELAAHDPTLLAQRETQLLRRLGMRFYLSCGSTHDRGNLPATLGFARLLEALRLPHELRLLPGGHDGRLWRAQLPAALAYAFPA